MSNHCPSWEATLSELSRPLEALLLLATEPVGTAELAAAVAEPAHVVEAELTALAQWYTETGRGFELAKRGGGWRFYTRPDLHDVVAEWLTADSSSRLSQAALETLAVIAYQQPISRSRVSAVRGVNVDGVVRTLLTRGLIEVVEVDPETGANLLATTSFFLEKIGLNTLNELPPLAPNLPDAVQLEAELAELVTEENHD